MFGQSLTRRALHDCLQALKPVNLLGTELMQRHSPTSLRPAGIPRDQLVTAVTELVDYSGRCADVLTRLTRLHAVPLRDIMTLEYGL